MAKKRRKDDGAASSSVAPCNLAFLGRSSFATRTAIDKLISQLKQEGMPESHSRRQQYRARKELCNIRTRYGCLVETETLEMANGEEHEIGVQNPQAFMVYNARHSQHYCQILREASERYPPSPSQPWDLCIYQDGVDPSDGLAKNHSRKSAVYYWAPLQVGMRAISHEEIWGTLAVILQTDVVGLRHHMTQMASKLMHRFHMRGRDVRMNGVWLDELWDGGPALRIFFAITMIVADEPALKEILDNKGHAGLMCCFGCMNATLHRGLGHMPPLWEVEPACISIAESDFTQFRKHSNRSLRKWLQDLHDLKGTMSDADFDQKCIDKGWNYNPYQIVLDKRLNIDVADGVHYDWGHVWVCDGNLDNDVGYLFKAFSSNGAKCSYSEFWTYMQQFSLPKCRGNLKNLFTREKIRNNLKNATFSSTASELLTIAPVLLRYLERVARPRNECVKQVESCIAALKAVEMLQICKTLVL